MGPRGFEEAQEKRPPQAYRMITDENFPKKEHILKTKDFRRAYKNGSVGRANGLVLYCLPNNLENSRIGFSIGSGNIRRATRRNWIRRRLREIYRRNKKNVKEGFDIVFVVKRDPGKGFPYKKIEEIFLKSAKEAKVLA